MEERTPDMEMQTDQRRNEVSALKWYIGKFPVPRRGESVPKQAMTILKTYWSRRRSGRGGRRNKLGGGRAKKLSLHTSQKK